MRRRSWPKITRDGSIYVVAMSGIVRELVVGAQPERIYAWIALLASPLVLRADETRRNGREDKKDKK